MNMNSFNKGVIIIMFLIGSLCMTLASCGSGQAQGSGEALLQDCPLVHIAGTSGVNLEISIDDFNALGFAYGDSVDIAFSNGYALEDIPYYSGYYVEAYAPLLVAYPGADYVKATINYGDDLWTEAGLQEDDTATVSIHEKEKYLEIQEADDIQYSDDREDFPSDEVFANFRSVTAGDIRENVLYRSASPCDNIHNRASYTDDLIEAAGVEYIVDLTDNDELIESYISDEDFDSPYFLKQYQESDVLPLYMSMNYLSEDFQKTLADGLNAMAAEEGPYLVHCTEGKDRTGFVCMLLEALCGADYQEIVDDYMLTYDNYYGITEESDPDRYNTIKEQNLDVMLQSIVSDDAADTDAAGSAEARPDVAGLTGAELSGYAKDYLLRIGLDEQTVEKLKERLE